MPARDTNQLRILNLVRLNPGISRAEIAQRTGLGKATVSATVAELIRDGIAFESGTSVQGSSAGRRPVRLELNSRMRLVVGVEFAGNEIIALLTDLRGEVSRFVRHPTLDTSVGAVVHQIQCATEELLEGVDRSIVIGMGVGVPAPVDLKCQRVLQAVNIGWTNVPLASLLEARTNIPALIVKRQHAGALGEYWYGFGRGKSSLYYVSVGVGIGSGIVIDGHPYQGAGGSAGEIGHFTVMPNGYRCRCGNLGCLETVAGSEAIAIRAREKIKAGRPSLVKERAAGLLETITARMVHEAAREGDRVASEVVEEAAGYLGIAIANVVNLLNPSLVIIGGDILDFGDMYIQIICDTVGRRALSLPLAGLEIKPSALSFRAAALGAATLVINQFFER